MKVILVEGVRGLGKMGEVVNVRPGYGRNFLIPQQKAVSATAANLSKFEAQRAELERKAKEALAVAEKQAAQINGKTINVTAKTGDEGRLFGSIGTSDIAKLLKESFDIQVARSEVKMPHGAIRQTGEHHIEIDLHSDVVATINVVVTAEV
jgi:large subunit ribosomal protein L9